MKKISLLLLMGSCSVMFAQNVKYGVTANAHITGINAVHDASKARFGGGVGAFATIPLHPSDVFKSQYMFIQPQVEFSTQGENGKAPGVGDQKFSNNYISAMFYFKYFFHNETERNNLFVFAGPKAEFLVSDSRETTPAYELAYGNTYQDKNVNSFGFGISGGVGYNFSENWEVFARYDQGLTKVYPDNPNNTFNGVIALGLNYSFSGNKVANDVAVLR